MQIREQMHLENIIWYLFHFKKYKKKSCNGVCMDPALPWDLLRLLMFKYFDAPDAVRLGMTCKRLYRFIKPIVPTIIDEWNRNIWRLSLPGASFARDKQWAIKHRQPLERCNSCRRFHDKSTNCLTYTLKRPDIPIAQKACEHGAMVCGICWFRYCLRVRQMRCV